jgi:hypothetical protein
MPGGPVADAAIEAMKQGAYDLFKPIDVHQLRHVVGAALQVARRMGEPAVVAETPPDPDGNGAIIGGVAGVGGPRTAGFLATVSRKTMADSPLRASDHGRGRSRESDPDQFDSTGRCTRAIRLTSWAASAARLRSEYLASGAEHVSSV